jgi:hypothetical protein
MIPRQWLGLAEMLSMKHKLFFFLVLVAVSLPARAQEQKSPPTLKSILLEQLRSTHTTAEWFVPANTAVAGLRPTDRLKTVPTL